MSSLPSAGTTCTRRASNKEKLLQVLNQVSSNRKKKSKRRATMSDEKSIDTTTTTSSWSTMEVTFCIKKRLSKTEPNGDLNSDLGLGYNCDTSLPLGTAAKTDLLDDSHDTLHSLIPMVDAATTTTSASRREALKRSLDYQSNSWRALNDMTRNTAPLTVLSSSQSGGSYGSKSKRNLFLDQTNHNNINNTGTRNLNPRSKSCRNLMRANSERMHTSPGRRQRRRRTMDHSDNSQKQTSSEQQVPQPPSPPPRPTLLPRKPSLRDLKVNKDKAKSRPKLGSRSGSFTTKQSEFAALEALMGKRPATVTKTSSRRQLLGKSKSSSSLMNSPNSVLDSPSRMSSSSGRHNTQRVGQRRQVALTSPNQLLPTTTTSTSAMSSPSHIRRPTRQGSSPSLTRSLSANRSQSMNQHHRTTPAQRRRNLWLLQNGESVASNSNSSMAVTATSQKIQQLAHRQSSMGDRSARRTAPKRLGSGGSNSQTLEGGSFHGDRRSLMLRQGSIGKGTTMRRLN